MIGSKFLLDTNVIIYHLAGSKQIENLLEGTRLYISAITYAELLAGNLTQKEEIIIENYLKTTQVVHTNDFICQSAAVLKKKYKIKLPDAFIASTGLFLNMSLVTLDKDFENISELKVITPLL